MGYSKQIIRGFSWAAVLNATAMAMSLAKIIILSRFVFGPTEFGIFGVGVLVLGILELLTETGINIFLIQEKGPLDKFLDTAWIISIARGVIIALTLAVLAYPISVFFKITSNWTFILAFSSLPLIRGFINPAITNLQKKLLFKQDSIYRFAISAIEDVSIVFLAFATRSVFSFVFGMLIGAVLEVCMTFIFVSEKPKLNFSRVHFGNIINRGKWVTLAQIFDYLFEHTDDVAVGKLLNVFSLGIYQNSYTLASLPENAVAQQLSKITFPIYVNIQNDKDRTKKAFWKTFWIVFALILPFGIGLFIFSDPAVRIILGNKWLPAIPVLRVLAIFSIARAMTNLFYPVFLAFKRQNYVSITTLVSWVVLGIFVVPMTMRFGIVGASTAALIGSVAGFPVALYLFKKLFD
jgi:O-antigen/teichoic acid export membrane protein